MSGAKVFYGGIPTDIDIRKLVDAYPMERMKAGDKYTYSEVGKLIGVSQADHRFRTVTNRWRGMVERETGKRIGAYEGEFFRVMTEPEKVEALQNKRKSIVKQVNKNIRRANLVDRKKLSEEMCRTLDHGHMNDRNMIAIQQLRGSENLFPVV